jgi:hypothetical protein
MKRLTSSLPSPDISGGYTSPPGNSDTRSNRRIDWWNKRPDEPLSRRAARALEAGEAIKATPHAESDIVFVPRWSTMLAMPRTKVGASVFQRQAGPCLLVIGTGHDDPTQARTAMPHGANARLVLLALTTAAKRQGALTLTVDDLLHEYQHISGRLDSAALRRGLQKQLDHFADCDFSVAVFEHSATGKLIEIRPKPGVRTGSRERLFHTELIALTPSFFIEKAVVPLDRRAVTALRGSSFSLDLYMWLVERISRVHGAPKYLGWNYLFSEFAACYSGRQAMKRFKKAFLEALQDVLTVYPRARVFAFPKSLMLLPSPPPVRAVRDECLESAGMKP